MKYKFSQSNELITPALVYYKDQLAINLEEVIELAGSVDRLWPHVKSHKASEMVKMQMDRGIHRFKCATIAEAEMVAEQGAEAVILAYPMVGPNIGRFIKLSLAYPEVRFFAIGDEEGCLKKLAETSKEKGVETHVLIDVNMGMNRTGIPIPHLVHLFETVSDFEGIVVDGLHCYDGHQTATELELRKASVRSVFAELQSVIRVLKEKQLKCDILVMGGTPSFPCYIDIPNVYCSPGTLFINDYGYASRFKDLHIEPAAAILTRVISVPKSGTFTLDLGYKGIASDPAGIRGKIVGLKHYNQLFQSEEHWVFKMEEGYEEECPKVGEEFFVVPTHICPTSALYPSIVVVENQEMIDEWIVTARNRKISY